MAYATKYLFKWESVNGTTREIRVLLDGYSGSVVQRRLGRAPVLKKQHNGNVYGTSLEFYAECTVDGEFAEFYTTDPKAYRVDLYSGNTLLWQGYITPELYAEPDIAPPYDVQVIATDGVGELKLYDFAPQGLVSLRSMLIYLLGYTGLTTDVYLISSIKPGGSGAAGSLLEKTINLDYMAGESCYEVLSYILDTLHATITWWKGAWILARETNVKFSSGKVQYFNTSGNAGTLAGSVVTLGKMYTNDAWPVGQLSSKIDPAKNSVRIQAPWHPVTALSNPDMTSDTGWAKAGGVVYDSTNKGYHLPEASLSAIPRISQTLSLSSLKNPMTLAAKVTGVSADLSLSTLFTAAMGFYVTYEVSGTTYHLERSDEGLVWKQGAMPSLLNYTNTIFTFLKTFDEDRTGAQTVDIEIPPFLLNNAFPAGTLAVYVFGGCVRVYGASLDVIISKGYQDNLYLDNDARGEGDEVEIAIGRETSAISPYQAFLQGILLDSGSLITSFKDDYITSSGLDFMSFIARDYARSFALPRIVQTGTVSLESSVTFPPLVFTKGALDYWLEGYSWNMLDDELDISARSLPTATITVDSETITEAGGTASSAAQGGSSSGGGSMPIGVNYFQIDEDLATLIQPKPQFDFLSPKKGLIFEETSEDDYRNSPAHLMLRNLGTQSEPNYALYTPYALITGGDQIVGSGTPGGGGGGAGYLYELGDIYHDTDKTKVLRTDGTTPAAVGDVLQLTSLTGGNKWAAVPATDIGRVYSGGTGITINGNEISVTANTYLPLAGGTMSGAITFANNVGIIGLTSNSTDYTILRIGSDNNTIVGPLAGITTIRSGAYDLNHNKGGTLYTIYDSGNLTKSVLTGLLDASGGYYLPLSGGTMSGTITTTATTVHQIDASNNDTWIWNVTDMAGQARRYGYGLLYEGSGSGIANYLKLYANNQAGTEVVSVCVNQSGQIGVLTTPSTSYSVNVSGALNATSIYENGAALSTSYQAKVSALGSSTNPVYVSAAGTFSTCGFSVNTGTANTLAYYSATGTISSLSNVTSAADGYILTLNSGSSSSSGIKFARGAYTGWGIYVSSGNLTFVDSVPGTDTIRLVLKETSQGGTATFSGGIVASSISKSGGASTEFLKADGSVDSTAYLPLTGGTMSGKLNISTAGNYPFTLNNTNTGAAYAGIVFQANGTQLGTLLCGTNGQFIRGGNYTIYDSGNSNSTSVAWSASSLTLNGSISGVSSINGRVSFPTSSSNNPVLNIQGVSSTGTDWLSIWVTATHRPLVFQYNAGNVGIGVAQPSNKLEVAGNIASTGDQVISSDINLKTHFKDITLTSEQIANAPAVSFDWKDGHGHSFGSIAQYWNPLVPESVLGEEGSYTLAYGQLGVVLGINNGKAIFKLEQHETEQDKEIKKLREKVQRLEEDNLRLKARLGLS